MARLQVRNSVIYTLSALLAIGCVTIAPAGTTAPGTNPVSVTTATATFPQSIPPVTVAPPATFIAQPTPGRTRKPPPSPTPAATPTAVPTDTPTVPPTDAPPTVAPTISPLDPGAASDELAINAGFTPDPYSTTPDRLSSGGPIDVRYLGGDCKGWASSHPSFKVDYTSAASIDLLRFYWVGTVDTTMVVLTPAGEYLCADDSFGSRHPTVDIGGPSSGRYTLWIASYSPLIDGPGTLYVTELPGNHPVP